MECWATVILVIGSNIVIGAVSIFTTRMQINHSHKQWFRELRSEPLVKLKNELALFATKYEEVLAAYSCIFNSKIPIERAGEDLVAASKDVAAYAKSGGWQHILFMIYDADIKDNVKKIINDYQTSADTILSFKSTESMKTEEWKNAISVSERNKTRIEQVQSMIDKRLGEL